jgi:hypothetical protein
MSEKEQIKAKYEHREDILYLQADSNLMKRTEDEYAELMEQEQDAARTNPQTQRELLMQQMEAAAKNGELGRFKELSSQFKALGSQTAVIETTVEDVQQMHKENGERAARIVEAQQEQLRREGLERRGIKIVSANQGSAGSPRPQQNDGVPADVYDANGNINMDRYQAWRESR